ncbi:MAG: SPOR domain-containing protein [Tannerella sp.]|jgi:cell division protein FtsN|nr:SPOR domain-containing protein [Tannerella sp.]
MNKIWLLGTAACLLLAFNSCKPKQSTYRAAYEQATQANDSTDEGLDDYSDDQFADDTDTNVSKPATNESTTTTTDENNNSNSNYDVNQGLNYATQQEQINPYPYQDNNYNAATGFQSLKRYNVVIGSFRNRTNASALRLRMQNEGYSANMVTNVRGMIRVVVATSDSRAEALRMRNQFRSKHYPYFQDAWILEQKY